MQKVERIEFKPRVLVEALLRNRVDPLDPMSFARQRIDGEDENASIGQRLTAGREVSDVVHHQDGTRNRPR